MISVGVKDVVLALGFSKDKIEWFVLYLQVEYKIKIICSVEETPLGTAGPLKLAEKYLKSKNASDDKNFIVLNSDILGNFKLDWMIKFHKEKQALGTIMLTEIEENFSRYGIVITNPITN